MAGWDQRRTEYAADGYTVIRSMVSEPTVRELTTAIEGAPDPDGAHNPLSQGAMRFASNLFGHSPALREFLTSAPVIELTAALLGPDAWVRWDQAVWKGPGAPEFPLHQDNGYTGRDAVHLQIWVALTPMGPYDGRLEVVPGGHRTRLEHRWVGDHAVTDLGAERHTIDAAPGDVIAFSSLLPHATAPNTGTNQRLAYVAEVLPLDTTDPSVPAPRFVICRRGRRVGRYERPTLRSRLERRRPASDR